MLFLKSNGFLVTIVLVCAVSAMPAFAANWLMLQGTEHPLAPEHRFWGFVQPSFTYDTSNELAGLTDSFGPPDFSPNNGKRLALTSVAPQFDDESDLHVRRARFGVRGIFTGSLRGRFTSKMNYFTLFEVAPNLMTYDPFGERVRTVAVDHFSLTFNHLPGARIRTGLFKTPGPEETFQGVHTLDYIEFTDFIAREQLERFVTGGAQPAGSPSSPTLGVPNNTAYGFNAVRDWGIQLFDSFKDEQWDLSYAVMLGRGEGIHETSDTDDNNELYLYVSAEYDLPGGLGPAKNGLKIYSWYQDGKRKFSSDNSNNAYDRERYGIGGKLLGRFFKSKYKYRAGMEFLFADGMIFIAPVGGVAQGNVGSGNLQIAAEQGNKSRAATLDFGFYPNNKWQYDLRFHRHDLLYKTSSTVNPGNERVITDTTLGLNYHFSRKIRLTFNYVIKDVEAPVTYSDTTGFPPTPVADGITSNVNTIVNTVDNRVLLQLTWII